MNRSWNHDFEKETEGNEEDEWNSDKRMENEVVIIAEVENTRSNYTCSGGDTPHK